MKGIHNWLSEPATNISFIEQAFGESSVKKAECDRKTDPFCSNCGFKYKMHRSYFGSGISTANYMYCPDRLRSQQVYKHCSALEVKHFLLSPRSINCSLYLIQIRGQGYSNSLSSYRMSKSVLVSVSKEMRKVAM